MPILDFPMPATAGDTYQGYEYDGVKWNKVTLTNPTAVYPSQSSNGGKFLTTNGSVVSWATVPPGEKGDRGDRGETGAQGVSVTLQGTKATIADLPAAPLDPNDYAGHGWIVTTGDGATHLDGSLWFWNLSLEQWDDIGLIVGPQGDKGDTGDQGPPGDPGDAGPAGTTNYNELTNTPQNLSDFNNDINKLVNGSSEAVLGSSRQLTLPGQLVFPNGGYIEDSEGFFVATDGVFQIQTNKTEGQQDWSFYPNGTLQFPDLTVQTTAWTGNIVSSSTTPPADSSVIWYNPTDGRSYVKYNDRWVDASPQVTQLVHWDDVQDTPTVPVVTAGTTPTNLLWNTDDGRLYVEYQGQWIEASPQLPLEPNINVESITFDDATVQSTAWLGDTVRADLTPADVWWDPEDGRAYIKYNEQWVDIAPTITPYIPSDISELTDDNGLLDSIGGITSYNDLTDTPDVGPFDRLVAEDKAVVFHTDGSITFPTLSTLDWNRNTLIGPTLQMGDDPTVNETVITGPAPDSNNPNAARLIIQGQQGWDDSVNPGEGGDVYIWAGHGGEGADYSGDGGDVKLRGGPGGLNGGYVRLEAGVANATGGIGGFLDLNAGDANNGSSTGGAVNIRGGQGVSAGGAVNIYTAVVNSGYTNQWVFDKSGHLTLPSSGHIVSPANNDRLGAPTFTTRSAGTRFVLWPQVGATDADYAIGMASTVMWSGIPRATDTYSFKWYGGTTEILKLQGNGQLTLSNSITFSDASVQSTAWTGTAAASSLTGTTLNSTVVTSSLTSVGTLDGLTVNQSTAGSAALSITAATSPVYGGANWQFIGNSNVSGPKGWIQFPNGTIQATAWTGTYSYDDLTELPTLFSGSYNDLTDTPTLFSGSYNDLTDTPTIYTSAYIGTTSLDFTRSSASQTLNGVSIDGNAATATSATSAGTLTTSRNINGVGFNGSANINVPSITDGTNTLKIVAVPSTLAGSAGDVKGNVAFDDTYSYYCKTSYGGSSYTVIGAAGTTASYVQVRKGSYPTPQAGWTITFGTPITITSVVDAGVIFGNDSWQLNLGTTVSSTGGASYTLIDTSSTIWVRSPWNAITGSVTSLPSLTSVGTLTELAVTTTTTSGAATVTYTPASVAGVALTATGKDTQGGIGYFDFLRATNTTSGATNPSKTFRLNSTGGIEILNNAYTALSMSISDSGIVNANQYQVGGKQAVNGPAFRAYIGNPQTVTSGSQQRVTFNSETFDTNSNFDSNRFTPTVEGYYQLNATVRISGTSGTGECMLIIWKNGSEYARGNNPSGAEQGTNFYSMQVSDLAYANGTTDYFEIYIQQSSGSSRETTAGANISYFSGSMIRGA